MVAATAWQAPFSFTMVLTLAIARRMGQRAVEAIISGVFSSSMQMTALCE